jgi:hypothetical protein
MKSFLWFVMGGIMSALLLTVAMFGYMLYCPEAKICPVLPQAKGCCCDKSDKGEMSPWKNPSKNK